jgi:energy-coupling factor transporter ATP-binding protein EcfA2
MRWELDAVAVDGAHAPLLRPTSLALCDGQVQLAVGPAGAGHTALALAAAGRIRPSSGRVLLDDAVAPAALRRTVAIVDAPGVSEPDGALPLATVVGEELAMARLRAGRGAVAEWLADRDAAELAAARPGVRALVLTAPDRHGIPPAVWWHIASTHAGHGLAVLVTAQEIAGALLDAAPALIGATDPGRPTTVLATPATPELDERTGS